jgi:hypothetical protein
LSLCYLVIGVVFILIGYFIVQDSNKVYELSFRYDDIEGCEADWQNPKTCRVPINIDQDLEGPIFIYYEIWNMYQNHRLYAKSRDPKQLMGYSRTKEEATRYCNPVVTMGDLGLQVDINYTTNEIASPCGLVARSVFNDTFTLYYPDGYEVIYIHTDKISWDAEKHLKFAHQDDWVETQWLDVEDEHFIVWMNISPLPYFRKLWGRIEHNLMSQQYYVIIENNYDIEPFSGEKYVVLSTTGAYGGKLGYIGYAFIAVGASAVLCSSLFMVLCLLNKRLPS